MTVLAFVIFALAGQTIPGLVAGVIVLDAGVQAGNVTNQSRIHNLQPEARNRLNTVYMVSFFLGGAAGSVLAAYAWQRWLWPGVCAVGLVMPLLATVKLSLPQVRSS
jgi:predicted MFS family arabinose efflux permease